MNTLMHKIDGYAAAVADTPATPTPVERRLAIDRIERAREAVQTAIQAQAAEIERLKVDAERYRWLRRNGLRYSYDHQLISLLVSKSELDAAMKDKP